MPKGYVINGEVVLNDRGFDKLPDFSKVVVRNYFGCNKNNLVSLKGCPYMVLGDFSCLGNKLTSLEGGPLEVGGVFSCMHNSKLESFNGKPKVIGGVFLADSDVIKMINNSLNGNNIMCEER